MKQFAIVAGVALFAMPAPAQAASPGEVFRDCRDCPAMVVVPAGSFVMGTIGQSPEATEHPAEHDLPLIALSRPFAIGQYEVTRREFAAFAAETSFAAKSPCRTWDAAKARFIDLPLADWRKPGFPRTVSDDQPVSCVDWFEARSFAAWLSAKTGHTYRLPSEAEWEYAAKAGTQTLRYWGDDPDLACDYANTFDQTGRESYPLAWDAAQCRDGQPDLAPVGRYRPNGFGLYDMIGNVWEWVEDCSSNSYVGRPKDERAWVWEGCKRRIQRGGSWMTAPARSRSAYHGDGRPGDRAVFFGFRLVRELAP
ncbi:MAG: formylglycine-generating enzyme family protein [Sphingomonas sp.]